MLTPNSRLVYNRSGRAAVYWDNLAKCRRGNIVTYYTFHRHSHAALVFAEMSTSKTRWERINCRVVSGFSTVIDAKQSIVDLNSITSVSIFIMDVRLKELGWQAPCDETELGLGKMAPQIYMMFWINSTIWTSFEDSRTSLSVRKRDWEQE